MARLLLITDSKTFQHLPAFAVVKVPLKQALYAMQTEVFAAVLMHLKPQQKFSAAWLREFQQLLHEKQIPCLLGIQSRTYKNYYAFIDGVIDLRWDKQLITSCIERFIALKQHSLRAEQDHLIDNAFHYHDLIFKDELTQLSNKRFFDKTIYKEHERCARYKAPYALVFVDLDNLKQINVRHGHVLGGEALAEIAETINSHTRKCDYAFRFGGDEFVVLLVNTNKHGAKEYAERLRQAFHELSISLEGEKIQMTASIGVSSFPEDGQTHQEILSNADRAMYLAKYQGKDRVVAFDAKTLLPMPHVLFSAISDTSPR